MGRTTQSKRPGTTKKRMYLYLSDEQMIRLKELAATDNISMSKFVFDLIEKKLSEQIKMDLKIDNKKSDHKI